MTDNPTDSVVTAWSFELARRFEADGTYSDFGPPQLSFEKPNVPEGSFRNLTALVMSQASPPPSDEVARLREENKRLREELGLWMILVNEGGVPRYTVTPGAALNTVVTSTKSLLARAALTACRMGALSIHEGKPKTSDKL